MTVCYCHGSIKFTLNFYAIYQLQVYILCFTLFTLHTALVMVRVGVCQPDVCQPNVRWLYDNKTQTVDLLGRVEVSVGDLPMIVGLGVKTLPVSPAASSIEYNIDKEPITKRHVIVARHRQLLSVRSGHTDQHQNISEALRLRIVFTTGNS